MIIESGDAIFYKENFPFKSKNSRGQVVTQNILSYLTLLQYFCKQVNFEFELSKRARVQKDFGSNFYVRNIEKSPFSLQEALSSLDAIFRKKTINDEMESPNSNKTWKLVDFTPSCKTIGCKCFSKRNLNCIRLLTMFAEPCHTDRFGTYRTDQFGTYQTGPVDGRHCSII